MLDLAEDSLSSSAVFDCKLSLFIFHPNRQPSIEAVRSATKNQKIYLSTMDLLVPATMKNAAKRDM